MVSISSEAVDRLSNLPDHIISHILSLLPIKIAATTSVLSKRWTYLFRSVSHIDLDEAWEKYPSYLLAHHHWKLAEPFYKFVNNLLLVSRDMSYIHSLRLRFKEYDHDVTDDWILAAINRHVHELTFIVHLHGLQKLPPEIFNCKTIRILRLHGCFYFDVPSSVNMPNLVELDLKYVAFPNRTCFDRISSTLTHLSLSHCRMRSINDDDRVIQFVSSSLTNLTLPILPGADYTIALHTPNLVCLDYKSSKVFGRVFPIVMEKLTHLTRVNVDFLGPQLGFEFTTSQPLLERLLAFGEFVNKFLEDIHNVKFLKLSAATLQALSYSPYQLPIFHNLTSIELGVNHIVGWQLLAKLLESSPNLQVLNFDKGFIDHLSVDKQEFEYCLPVTVPMCFLKTLRQIKVGDFYGGKCEFELIEYFLRSGKVLEEIKICSQTFSEWSSSFCEKLLGYPKCSKTCKIVVCWMADGNLCKRCINCWGTQSVPKLLEPF